MTIANKVKTRINSHFHDARNSKIVQTTTFLSDSLQNWRNGCMCNHIDKRKKLIVLTHPIWWTKHNYSRKQILEEFEQSQTKTINKFITETRKTQKMYIKKLQKGIID